MKINKIEAQGRFLVAWINEKGFIFQADENLTPEILKEKIKERMQKEKKPEINIEKFKVLEGKEI